MQLVDTLQVNSTLPKLCLRAQVVISDFNCSGETRKLQLAFCYTDGRHCKGKFEQIIYSDEFFKGSCIDKYQTRL